MSGKTIIDDFWDNNPVAIRKFIDLMPIYKNLCEEVAYILEKAVIAEKINYSSISYRVKSVASFCEKVKRKNYQNADEKVTDIAGVRIVYLYLSERNRLEKIIEREFAIIEKFDKIDPNTPDRFGYGALHYLIQIGKKSMGARYDDLKDLVCEIQVRTILQDAWANVAHHLSYKRESDIPKELRRKLNALSGLFETADDQFDMLRKERVRYRDTVKRKISEKKEKYLLGDINADNLIEFLKYKFPRRDDPDFSDINSLLSELKRLGYMTFDELDEIISRSEDAIKAYEEKYPPWDPETGDRCPFNTVGAVRAALTFINEKYRRTAKTLDRHSEFMHLVKNT